MFEFEDAVEEADGERDGRGNDFVVAEGRRNGSVKRVRAVSRVGEGGGMAEKLLWIRVPSTLGVVEVVIQESVVV